MKSYTQSGLLFLMISMSISLVSIFFLYSFSYSVNPETFSAESFSRFFTVLLPISMIVIIAGILSIIGVLFVFLGRKEFGPAHEKSIKYALIIFALTVVIMIVVTIGTSFLTFFYISQSASTADSGSPTNLLMNENFFTIIFFTSVISAAIGGLIWVFGLYQLENDIGKKIVLMAYAASVATALIVAWSSSTVFHEMFSSGALQNIQQTGASSYSSISSYYPWIGTTGLVSLIGNTVSSLLYLGALYIPYKRIKSGELVVVHSSAGLRINGKTSGYSDRHCPNCGRVIPFDALICPYCEKKFDEFQ